MRVFMLLVSSAPSTRTSSWDVLKTLDVLIEMRDRFLTWSPGKRAQTHPPVVQLAPPLSALMDLGETRGGKVPPTER